MANLQWRRVGKKSGPANVLNNRFVIAGAVNEWRIIDRHTGDVDDGFTSMKDARLIAERKACKACPTCGGTTRNPGNEDFKCPELCEYRR